eukprot:SAG11_NODE_3755_length_2250_cov_1.357508_2_plen_51_part_00
MMMIRMMKMMMMKKRRKIKNLTQRQRFWEFKREREIKTTRMKNQRGSGAS